MNTKKRFIAGAMCPVCKQLDKIMMYRQDDIDYRECVACGYQDEMRFKPAVREMETRVNISHQQVQQETQVVRLMESDSKDKPS